MNELLLSELNRTSKPLLASLALIEEHIFDNNCRFEESLNPIIESCKDAVDGIDDSTARAEVLINALFVDELFIDNERNFWPTTSQTVDQAIRHRVIAPILKGAIIQRIATECELEAELVFVPEKVMVRIICDDIYSVIFDPVTGESVNWEELDRRLDGLSEDPQNSYLAPMELSSLLVEHLTGLKSALIKESLFSKALKCVDLLLALRPNDPFERRDRGYLLHQLDCFKVACDDYQFFVEQCPKDPAAQLLKLQLDQIKLSETMLH